MVQAMNPFEEHLLPIYRAFRPDSADPRRGTLQIADETLKATLQRVLDDPYRFGVRLAPAENQTFQIGEQVQLCLDDPAIGLGLLANNLDNLLEYPPARIRRLPFYLLDKHVASADPELAGDEDGKRYVAVIDFVNELSKAAAYLDRERQEIIFIKADKVVVPVIYTATDLRAMNLDALKNLLGRCTANEAMGEQCQSMLADAVLAQCAGVEPKRRFTVLLSHLGELLRTFDDNYRLYLSNFSYDKVRDELLSAKLDELSKINKTFADVQGQVLGIPVATIVVATQMKLASSWNAQAWVNVAVLLGVFVFVMMAWFAVRNQVFTLKAIEQDIARKKAKVETDYTKVKDLVSDTFPELERRARAQLTAFWVIRAVMLIGALIAVIIFVVMTEPCSAWLREMSVYLIHGGVAKTTALTISSLPGKRH